jgi:hypothetical protein
MAAAVSITGGIGAPNTGGDTEIYGVVNSMSYYDKTDSQAGLARGEREWILRPSTQYCLYMKSLNANDNIHTLDIHWYEVDHKDGTSSH